MLGSFTAARAQIVSGGFVDGAGGFFFLLQAGENAAAIFKALQVGAEFVFHTCKIVNLATIFPGGSAQGEEAFFGFLQITRIKLELTARLINRTRGLAKCPQQGVELQTDIIEPSPRPVLPAFEAAQCGVDARFKCCLAAQHRVCFIQG